MSFLGAGGTGGLLIQMAKLLGATVITTVSNEAKKQIALSHGADHVIIYTQTDFYDKVMEITQNKGVNAVYGKYKHFFFCICILIIFFF